jgi:outer membrane protein assembly factor BamB
VSHADDRRRLALADFEVAASVSKDLLPSTLNDLLLKHGKSSRRYEVILPNTYLAKVAGRYREELRLGRVPADAGIKPEDVRAELLLIPSASRVGKALVVSATLADLKSLQPVATFVVECPEDSPGGPGELVGLLWRRIELEVVWLFETGGRIRHLVADDRTVAFWSHDGHLYVLDRPTGRQLWKRDEAVFDDPIVTDAAVYFSDKDGLHKVGRDTGIEGWLLPVKGGGSAPVRTGKHVFFGGLDNFLWCVNDADGKEVWRYAYRDLKWSSNVRPTPAVVDGDRVYFTCDSKVHCVRRADGKPVWQTATETGFPHRLVVFKGDLYLIGAESNLLQSFAAADGKRLWNYHLHWPAGNKSYPRPLDSLPFGLQGLAKCMISTKVVASDESLFFGLSTEKRQAFLTCLKPSNAQVRWNYLVEEPDDPIIAQPTLAGNSVFFTTIFGRVYAVNTDTGRKHWKLDLEDLDGATLLRSGEKGTTPPNARPFALATQPVVVGNVVYFGTMKGSVYAVKWR